MLEETNVCAVYACVRVEMDCLNVTSNGPVLLNGQTFFFVSFGGSRIFWSTFVLSVSEPFDPQSPAHSEPVLPAFVCVAASGVVNVTPFHLKCAACQTIFR